MTDWNEMLVQLDKERLKRTSERWTSAQGLQLENEFSNTDENPNETSYDFPNITQQTGKKRVSKKSTKERIAEKTISLAKRLEYQTYK
jgi:hypothetical protein